MKSKIITLAVAFVLGVTAIAFSVRPSAAPSGKGSGKNTKITDPKELAEIVSNLPSAEDYYEMAQKAALGKDQKSVSAAAAATENDFRSLSIFDDFSMEYRDSRSSGAGTDNYSEFRNYVRMYQKCSAYYTAEAVYYNINYTLISESATTFNSYATRTSKNSRIDLDADFYLGVAGGFLRYNSYDIIIEDKKVVDGQLVEEDEKDTETLAKEEIYNALSKSFGKWINIFDYDDVDLDTPPDGFDNMSEDEQLNLMAKMMCSMVSSELAEMLMSSVKTDMQSILKMAGLTALAEDKSNDYYDKTAKLYKMTPFGRYTMLSRFGYEPSEYELENATSSNGKIDYNKLYPVKTSSFLLDMSKGDKPTWYMDFNDVGDNSLTMHETFYVTNIDNTVVPKVSSKKNLFDYLGKTAKNILKKLMEEN